MKISKVNAENLIKTALFCTAAAGSVYKYFNQSLELFLLLFLIFILNNRIRITVLKNKFHNAFILSILLDFMIIYFLNRYFPFISYILIYITVLDSLSYLKEEGYIISLIAFVFLIYILYFMKIDIIIFNILIYIIIVIFAITLKAAKDSLEKSEMLYDENRKYSYQLEDSKKMLKDYAKKIEDISQLEERNRISREIHDSVGHKLTGVLMQLDAAIRVSDKDSEKGIQIARLVRDNLSKCIDLMRSTVRNIAPPNYYNIITQIELMINDFKNTTNVDVSFEVNGNLRKLPAAYEVTIYKNIEEALTNAIKHGNADKANVSLDYKEKMVTVLINNNGKGCSNIIKGMGISGMEERAKLIGAVLKLSSNNGFEVELDIPVKDKHKMYED